MFSHIGDFVMRDKLSLYFVFLIILIVIPVFIYSTGYIKEYEKKYNTSYLWLMMIIFVLAMLGVVISSNSISFVVFWELMSASSFLLVIYDYREKENIKAGIMYFIMTHLSGLLIMIMFAFIYKFTGSMDFVSIIKTWRNIKQFQVSLIIIFALLGLVLRQD